MDHVTDWDQYPNFTKKELDCQETGENFMTPRFMGMLQEVRTKLNRSIQITSGYRSERHSIEAAKDAPGWHAKGRAVDIACKDSALRGAIIYEAIQAGFTGIGVSDSFIHLDDRRGDEGTDYWPICWTY